MIVINGINCEELVANFSEGYGLLDGPTAQKGFLCPWGDRHTVAKGLLGLSATTHIGELTLHTPLQYPELSTMYAHDINIQGVGFPQEGTNGVMAFYRAIVSVNYQSLPWSFEGLDYQNSYANNIDPITPMIYCRQTMDIIASNIGIPGSGMKFKTSGKPLNKDWKMIICEVELSLQFIRVPYLPAQQVIIASEAPVNSTTFLGFLPGFCHFNGMHNEQSRDTDGNFTQDATFTFSGRTQLAWDQEFDPSTGLFDQVVIQHGGNAGNPILMRSDLNALIPPGYRI